MEKGQKARAGRAVLRAWRGSEHHHAVESYDPVQSHLARGAGESIEMLAKIGSSVF